MISEDAAADADSDSEPLLEPVPAAGHAAPSNSAGARSSWGASWPAPPP